MTVDVTERRQRRQTEPTSATLGTPALSVARVDLLPPVVEVRRRQGLIVRLLSLGLVVLLLIVATAGFLVALVANAAEDALAAEQTRTRLLALEESKYSDVSAVKVQLLDHSDAELAALFAEADWSRLMTELDDVLPEAITLTTETISLKGISEDAPAAETTGLDAPGVIEIAFTATAAEFVTPTPLLNALSELTGYQSATVDSVSESDEDGYTISGIVQLGTEALGGTPRVEALDPEALELLHQTLEDLVTGAAAAQAEAEGAADDLTDAVEGE
ncbi:hypothetical protein AB3M83_07420 [Microbacterium sp. 179-B 1A2 NHS]|uniref:hypothetical protein n=1 Tax=Microbacterium sp. 179-B 1A2 NHS TaxID=3142383 RepID=UPI0039A08DD5